MGEPATPAMLHQGPANSCVINGRALGWVNCTPTSTAMGVRRATLNRKTPTGCDIRRLTGDTSGGTSIAQCAAAAETGYGVSVAVMVGDRSATPNEVSSFLRAGRGLVAQGYTGALLDTPWQTTGGGVNHAVWVNEGKGWHANTAGVLVPTHVKAFDPAADGRVASWGRADDGPSWWTWAAFKAFCAALRPWGDGDPRRLGAGRVYAGVFPDTEPHVHLAYGAKRTSPFPDRTVVDVPAGRRARVRSRPDRIRRTDVVDRLPDGAPFVAYQTTRGAKPTGATSDVWFGDHDGRRWIHISSLSRIGGQS